MKNLILVHLESVSELILNTNPELFPNINKIIEESIYYKNYYSSATSTLMVMSDICYGGMYREKCTKLENSFNNTEGHFSLFDDLKSNGYSVKGIIWPQIITYSKIINGKVLGNNMHIIAAENYASFIRSIDESITKSEPFALFIANFVSHISYRNDKEILGNNSYFKWKEGYRRGDTTCKEIINLLKKRKKEDNTIIVFYGDHGDDYWGHRLNNGYTHAIEPYSSIIHTPLIIWGTNRDVEMSFELLSSLDIKSKIMGLMFEKYQDIKRQYIFSRNIYANQKNDIMSLSKGYAVATKEYILLVSKRGLELYNMDMDPANTCNVLEFFNINKKGSIRFYKNFKNIRSWHFRDFFSDKEIIHLIRIYGQLRRKLIHETEIIYKNAKKSIYDRNKELNFFRINRCHFFNIYNKAFINIIEKWFR